MKRILAIYLLLAITAVTFSQTEKVINPADLKQKTVITEPLSLPKGFLRVGLFYTHSTLDKYFNTSGKKDYFPESSWGSSSSRQIIFQYGITDRFMVEADVPFVNDLTNVHTTLFYPEFDTMKVTNASNRGKGPGDIMLSGTWQIIPSGDNPFSLKSSVDITIPTGRKNPKNIDGMSFDSPTGYGVLSVLPRISARILRYPYSFISYLSYNFNFKGSRIMQPADTKETGFKYGNSLNAGISAGIHLNEWIALVNEISYYHSGKGEIDGVPDSELYKKWAVSYEPRIVFQVRKFRLGEAVNIPLKGKYVGADPLYVLMIQYVF